MVKVGPEPFTAAPRLLPSSLNCTDDMLAGAFAVAVAFTVMVPWTLAPAAGKVTLTVGGGGGGITVDTKRPLRTAFSPPVYAIVTFTWPATLNTA